jgi:NAD(P)-dependent dehydrogenase (short-subunit alcohol dehydrogenase family)
MMTSPTGRLAGKVAIVTGAGSIGPGWGNGKATAVAFAREGAAVMAVDRSEASAMETRDIIRGEGARCEVTVADVGLSADVAGCVEATLAAFGRVDILHNNVGIFRLGGPVELDECDWDQVITTNLKSLFLTCKYVLPHFEQQRSGAIVNVGSISGHRHMGVPQIAYATSKAAIAGFTRGIAAQYGVFGIRANVVVPGLIDTPLQRMAGDAAYGGAMGSADLNVMRTARTTAIPLKRFGEAWDVAAASVFLASDEARYISGAELMVDGGLASVAATATISASPPAQPANS